MPRKRHSEERIIYALKQIEGGAKGLDENRRLRGLVADLTLDKHILQEVLRKKP